VLRVRGKVAYLIGAYLIAYADIVIILELAGLLSAIDRASVLALQILLTAIALLVWQLNARPELFAPFRAFRLRELRIQEWLKRGRQYPLPAALILLLAVSVGYVYLRHAERILVVPPNNWDSLTYHLSRVGYWLQYKSLFPWPTTFLHQTTLPMNAELGLLWTILWWGTDQLTGFVQWMTIPVIVLAIYGLVRQLGYGRRQAVLAALLWPTLTQVLYQSSTTQNDLVTTSFWVAALYFLFAALRDKEEPYPYLSGLALGLAIGTKGTSLLVLPGLAAGCLLIFWLHRREAKFKALASRWIAASLVGVLLFGSFIYVQNMVAFGAPLGPLGGHKGPTDLATVDLGSPDLVPTLSSLLRDNVGRYIYQLVDFSAVPFGAGSKINPVKATVFSAVFRLLHIPIENKATVWTAPFTLDFIGRFNEDDSWFGPLGAVMILAVAYQAYLAVRNREALRLTLAFIAIGFLLAHSTLQFWFPGNGRYYMVPIALAFPFMADFLDTRRPWRSAVTSVLVLLGLTVMFNITLTDGVLQRVTWKQVLTGERLTPAWASEFNYRMVVENIPQSASVGTVSVRDFRDYPFFGEKFTRRLTRAIPDERSTVPHGDTTGFASDFQHSDFLFIQGTNSHFIPDLASKAFDLLTVYNGDSLYIRKDLRSSSECDDKKWPFPDFYGSSTKKVCSQFPLVPGTVSGGFVQTVFLHDGQFLPVIGVGSHAMFKFSLLVKEPTRAKFAVQVEPRGTARSQTLLLALLTDGSQPMAFSSSFSTRKVLTFAAQLEPGTYRVQLGLANGLGASIHRFQVSTP
jgi:4-amino-4-deoxy-L-arabinose transferase-like glycosyltransferase